MVTHLIITVHTISVTVKDETGPMQILYMGARYIILDSYYSGVRMPPPPPHPPPIPNFCGSG